MFMAGQDQWADGTRPSRRPCRHHVAYGTSCPRQVWDVASRQAVGFPAEPRGQGGTRSVRWWAQHPGPGRSAERQQGGSQTGAYQSAARVGGCSGDGSSNLLPGHGRRSPRKTTAGKVVTITESETRGQRKVHFVAAAWHAKRCLEPCQASLKNAWCGSDLPGVAESFEIEWAVSHGTLEGRRDRIANVGTRCLAASLPGTAGKLPRDSDGVRRKQNTAGKPWPRFARRQRSAKAWMPATASRRLLPAAKTDESAVFT